MPARKDAWFVSVVGVVLIALISLPYLWAYSMGNGDSLFGGFLFNPIDGYSYLAKMQAGYQGSWKYSLPYSLEQSLGAYLFTYYIFLGHLARISHLSISIFFHLARLAGTVTMVLALWRFYSRTIQETFWQRFAFVLSLFGAGLGWLAMAAGVLTADLWVAEAFPFLSSFANPHFPLGLALLAWLLAPSGQPDSTSEHGWICWETCLVLVASLSLAIILPFGSVVALVVLAGLAAWDFFQPMRDQTRGDGALPKIRNWLSGSGDFRKLLLTFAAAVPLLLYYRWVTISDPIFRGWNAQNLTLSPAWWDVIISFSPLLLVAIPGGWNIWREKRREPRVLLVWGLLGLILVYLPFGLQRRFFTGLLIPLAGLAALGLREISERISPRRAILAGIVVFVLVIPTNLANLLVGIHGVQTRADLLFLSADERDAIRWLEYHVPQGVGILTGPEIGLVIPAFSGRRVVYGHPFETVEAAHQEELVVRLFSGDYSEDDLDILSRVDFVFYGPRERRMGDLAFLHDLEIAWRNHSVIIYRSLNSPLQ